MPSNAHFRDGRGTNGAFNFDEQHARVQSDTTAETLKPSGVFVAAGLVRDGVFVRRVCLWLLVMLSLVVVSIRVVVHAPVVWTNDAIRLAIFVDIRINVRSHPACEMLN